MNSTSKQNKELQIAKLRREINMLQNEITYHKDKLENAKINLNKASEQLEVLSK